MLNTLQVQLTFIMFYVKYKTLEHDQLYIFGKKLNTCSFQIENKDDLGNLKKKN
jgi:hypothetical protein